MTFGDPLIIKEILVSRVPNIVKAGVVLIVGAVLSGCAIRPLGWGWGDHDGRGRGERHQVDSDRDHGRSPGYDNSRDDGRRRGW